MWRTPGKQRVERLGVAQPEEVVGQLGFALLQWLVLGEANRLGAQTNLVALVARQHIEKNKRAGHVRNGAPLNWSTEPP